MPICFVCDEDVGSLRHHLTGAYRHPKCAKIGQFYDAETQTCAEWALLTDGKDKVHFDEDAWRKKYGTGDYSVYVYMVGRRVARVGKAGDLSDRLRKTETRPADNEDVYVLASGLSEYGASLLEASLISCHDIHSPNSRLRCHRYEAVRPPKEEKCAVIRAEAVRVLRRLYELIEAGEVRPYPKPARNSARRVTDPDAELDDYTEAQLAKEEERLKSRLDKVQRLRQKKKAERGPAQKRRRTD